MMWSQISENVNPTSPLDWGVIAVVVFSVIASVGTGAKRVIEWVVTKITAPDTRIEELEKEKTERETEDRARFLKLEKDVETLRAEVISLHVELKLSEVARARTEGELEALKRQIDRNTEVTHTELIIPKDDK